MKTMLTVLSITLVAYAAAAHGDELKCGRYLLNGKLENPNVGTTLLNIYEGSKGQYSVRLFGVSLRDIQLNKDVFVKVEASVERPVLRDGSHQAFMTDAKIVGTAERQAIQKQPISLIETKPCKSR